MAEEHSPETNGQAGYEVGDADVRQVLLAGIGLAAGTALACLAMYFLFNILKQSGTRAQLPTINPMATSRTLPPDPRLQVRPWEEIQNLRLKEDQVLTTYGWTNKAAGTVRIPIDKAMDIVVQGGLPARAQDAPVVKEVGNAPPK